MSVKLSGPILAPQSGAPPHQIVVLLHGYGSDGQDLISLGGYWQDILPDALFVAPNAPDRSLDNPMGYQWFPVVADKAADRFGRAAAGRGAIVDVLEALWAQTDLGPRETVLVGFSQGAMMALHVGLSLDAPLMGIVAFAGMLIPPAGFAEGGGPKPPICLVHGDEDRVVDPKASADAAELLRAKGFSVSYHVARGAGHTITPDGLSFAGDFITAVSATL